MYIYDPGPAGPLPPPGVMGSARLAGPPLPPPVVWLVVGVVGSWLFLLAARSCQLRNLGCQGGTQPIRGGGRGLQPPAPDHI